MNIEWIKPQVIVLTTEEVAEMANIDLACAGQYAGSAEYDHS